MIRKEAALQVFIALVSDETVYTTLFLNMHMYNRSRMYTTALKIQKKIRIRRFICESMPLLLNGVRMLCTFVKL